MVWIAGMAANTTSGGGETDVCAYYGTGTPPSAGSTTPTGTVAGLMQHVVLVSNTSQSGFTIMDKLTGLAINTTYWFDVMISSPQGGGAYIKDVQGVALEV